MNVPPVCHQDDVIDTLIQPGSPGFKFSMQIPATEPPGLVLVPSARARLHRISGERRRSRGDRCRRDGKVRPEVTGLTERVFVIRQQYLVPWIPGPYQLTLNYLIAPFLGSKPIIQMRPVRKSFGEWQTPRCRIFWSYKYWTITIAKQLELVALDGYPLARDQRRRDNSDSAGGAGGVYRESSPGWRKRRFLHPGILHWPDR